MKQFFFMFLLAPLFVIGQSANSKTNTFELIGEVSGYEDGTSVSFLNDQTGLPEKQASIEKGKFIIQGEIEEPTFKVLVFGDQLPAIPIFLENGKISIKGDKANAESMAITGSETHVQYVSYSNQIRPYIPLFQDISLRSEEKLEAIEKIASDFIKKNPSSYVSPIVLVQLMQLDRMPAVEKLFTSVSSKVKETDIARYIQYQIEESKINAIGSIMEDFSQEDTAGQMVSLKSFRGKYVLIDFWASWCRPCRDENPNIVANFHKFADKNFTVLGVSLDQAKPAWINAINMDKLAWTQLSDLKGWRNEVAAQFRITQIPKNVLIDPTGKIIAKDLRGPGLGKKLEEIFGSQ